MNSSKNQPVSERRKFFLDIARAAGLAILGGLTWSAYVSEVRATSLILRPPGALDENDFLATCIKCGMCVEACPFDTLKLAKPGDNKPLGTPFFEPRKIPCYMCTDIPCVPVCPTNALNIKSVQNKDNKLDISKAKMGVAKGLLSPGFANFKVSNGHASTHIPHLIQVAKKSFSSRAPGGLNINEVALTSLT
jgi:ferredoxin-type protein NapG